MQKLAKRVTQAERQVARRRAKAAKVLDSYYRRTGLNAIKDATKEVRENLEEARRAQREEWELGPLAPARDFGYKSHGIVQKMLRRDWSMDGKAKLRKEVLEQRCAWAGGTERLSIVSGDRVVIVQGREKNKIDTIDQINMVSGTVTLANCNKALISVTLDANPRLTALPLPIDAVRLVYPLMNAETGKYRDTMIGELKPIAPNMQSPNMDLTRWEHGKRWDRLVPGLNVVIPWPETTKPKYEAHDTDTLRDRVEERTFYYPLTSAPMPEQIIDELRYKYSKFRTRHEAWYIEKKEQEAAYKARRSSGEVHSSMRTPLDEFQDKQRKLREEQGEPQLNNDMLGKIGHVMAKNAELRKLSHAAQPKRYAPR
ncbi:hypothetical protein CDD81_6284 [Ophiocordyceps australis]|uniref:KOW domain-containing protein n=1 Tax=Ophiocordyceps australis TaxID=1399860 RepID=A0A2C5Y682_9HYPO|nr:hypothetical protein CDD81_6284 [Ophiocordyceps australis]